MEQVTAGDVAAWDAGLETLADRLSGMLHRPEPKTTFGLVLRALLADVPKKNSGAWPSTRDCPPHARSSTGSMARSGTPA